MNDQSKRPRHEFFMSSRNQSLGLLYLLEFRFLTNTERVKLVTVCVTVNRFSDSVYASLAINTRKFAGFESLRTFLKKYTRFDLILCFDPQPDNSGR